MMLTRLHNRAEAGRKLGLKLVRYASRGDVVVLGLPRGGVPVAFEVARALAAPLDVFIVRKLGAPGYHELAMGAIASGGARVINDDVVASLGIPHFAIERTVVREEEEIERRERLYRGRRPPADVRGKIVILADDGMATGACMLVALKALGSLRPARLVVAVGVSSPSACSAVGEIADECVCVLEPDDLGAISPWYEEFEPTGDEEVCALLAKADERPRGRTRHAHRAMERRAS